MTKGETMNLDTVLLGATPRQRDFISQLLSERDYTLGEEIMIDSPAQASSLISNILRSPRRVTPIIVDTELFEALSSVQKSKYAIQTSELFLDLFDEKIENDLLFVEVSEYNNKLQIKRLHGSVGNFLRSKLSRQDSLQILRHLAPDTYKYARLFGEHYKCCGKCGAALTDELSRKFQMGPTCRKSWGL
jgi:hypothetical protein